LRSHDRPQPDILRAYAVSPAYQVYAAFTQPIFGGCIFRGERDCGNLKLNGRLELATAQPLLHFGASRPLEPRFGFDPLSIKRAATRAVEQFEESNSNSAVGDTNIKNAFVGVCVGYVAGRILYKASKCLTYCAATNQRDTGSVPVICDNRAVSVDHPAPKVWRRAQIRGRNTAKVGKPPYTINSVSYPSRLNGYSARSATSGILCSLVISAIHSDFVRRPKKLFKFFDVCDICFGESDNQPCAIITFAKHTTIGKNKPEPVKRIGGECIKSRLIQGKFSATGRSITKWDALSPQQPRNSWRGNAKRFSEHYAAFTSEVSGGEFGLFNGSESVLHSITLTQMQILSSGLLQSIGVQFLGLKDLSGYPAGSGKVLDADSIQMRSVFNFDLDRAGCFQYKQAFQKVLNMSNAKNNPTRKDGLKAVVSTQQF
jgi:hypothetical protein